MEALIYMFLLVLSFEIMLFFAIFFRDPPKVSIERIK